MYIRILKNNQNWRREKHFYLDVRTICFSPNGDLALRRRNKRIIERLCWWTRWILKNEITSIWDDISFLLIIGEKLYFLLQVFQVTRNRQRLKNKHPSKRYSLNTIHVVYPYKTWLLITYSYLYMLVLLAKNIYNKLHSTF